MNGRCSCMSRSNSNDASKSLLAYNNTTFLFLIFYVTYCSFFFFWYLCNYTVTLRRPATKLLRWVELVELRGGANHRLRTNIDTIDVRLDVTSCDITLLWTAKTSCMSCRHQDENVIAVKSGIDRLELISSEGLKDERRNPSYLTMSSCEHEIVAAVYKIKHV